MREPWGQGPLHYAGACLLPFKANAARRHHIPKQRHQVTNWAEYDAGLRARGSLTVWFTPEAVAAWRQRRAPPGAGSPPTLIWRSPRP